MQPINYVLGFLLVFCLGSQLEAQKIALELGRAEGAFGNVVEVPIWVSTDQSISSLEIAVTWDGSRATGAQLKDLIAEAGSPGELVHKVRVENDYAIYVVALNPATSFVTGPGEDIRVATLELSCLSQRNTQAAAVSFVDGAHFATDATPFPITNRVGGRFDVGGTFELDSSTEPVLELVGGSFRCATIESTVFKRGDIDTNGTADLSDAILTLYFLFLGTFEPDCLDAGDANDDGKVDLTDPIFLLVWLFLSGNDTPPDPGPFTCGIDPTLDSSPIEGGEELDCVHYPATSCPGTP